LALGVWDLIKYMTWIWIIIVLAIVGGVWYMMKGKKKEEAPKVEEPKVEEGGSESPTTPEI